MKLRISEPERQPSPAAWGGPPGVEEPLLLAEQGVYLGPGRSSWQIGQLNLTAARLRFVQPRGVLFDMPLDWLLGVTVERKHYVVVRKPAMAVTFQDPRLRDPSTAWFLTPLLGPWLAQLNALLGLPAPPDDTFLPAEPGASATGPGALRPVAHASGSETGSGLQIGSLRPVAYAPGSDGVREVSGRGAARPAADGRVLRPPQQTPHTGAQPPLSPHELARLMKQLDPASRTIVEHLSANSHATIRELASVIEGAAGPATSAAAGTGSDMEVLFCIRRNINPTARALLGRPVLFFVESQMDQVTGEQVSYAWWLAGSRGRTPQWRELEAEVFDEGAQILVVVELPGAGGGAIDCDLEGEQLTVRAADADRRWRSTVALPAAVDPQPAAQQVNNGILSIHLRKQIKER